jgi:hypothetical protein
MPVMFEETIYTGESRPVTVYYKCTTGLTATFVGTCTVTIKSLAGTIITGYNASNVDRQDTGSAASLEMEKEVDCSTGQIPVGLYEMTFLGTATLSEGPPDTFEIIGALHIKPATLDS